MKKIKLTLLSMLLGVLAVAGLYWAYPDSPPAQAIKRWLMPLKQAVMGSGSTELHKCVAGSKTEYSSGKCPPGSREIAIEHGTVTVLPATPVPTPTASAASAPAEPSLAEKRIERAVGN